MKPLYIDIGNSRIKIAVYKEPEWEIVNIIDRSRSADLVKLIERNHPYYSEIHVSSVLKAVADDVVAACPAEKLYFFTNGKIPDERISYENHATIGVDRFLAATGAWSQTHNSCIVIDAGTACTIDYIDKQSIFQGGVIMPGLRTIEGEFANSAKALPPVDRIIPNEWPPKSTNTALQWGIFGSFTSAVEAHMKRFLEYDEHAEVWLTGGDAGLLKPILPSGITRDDNLIFKGLKHMAYSSKAT
ncbi:MAG: type III pantothenate kinase [Balneolales bacterium]